MLAKHCPLLRNLRLDDLYVTNEELVAIATGCKHLKQLSLYTCQGVQDSGVRSLAECCPGLENLNLYRCNQITDLSLKYLSEKSSQLTCLDLSYCLMHDDGIQLLSRLSNLHTLHLQGIFLCTF